MEAPQLFDREARRQRRARAARTIGGADYLHRRAGDELLERLDLVTRSFTAAAVIGALGHDLAPALRARGTAVLIVDHGFGAAAGGVQADEDRLPIADGSVDLVIALGTLDTVNDLPGALLLIRRALAPGGLFLGALSGAGSLPRLRAAMMAADEAEGRGAAPRLHPQVDVRSLGDLLLRAGFVQPVVDGDSVDILFPSLAALVADLRATGAGNVLAARSRVPIGRRGLGAARASFAAAAGSDGRTTERAELLYLTAWKPQ